LAGKSALPSFISEAIHTLVSTHLPVWLCHGGRPVGPSVGETLETPGLGLVKVGWSFHEWPRLLYISPTVRVDLSLALALSGSCQKKKNKTKNKAGIY
jgi:hypothetical protein